MLEAISQNVGSPVFWMALGWFATAIAIVSSVLYRQTRSSSSDQRNRFLRNSVFVAIGWIIVSLVRVFIIRRG